MAQTLKLRPGYWRASDSVAMEDVLKCWASDACKGGAPALVSSTRRALADDNQDNFADGYCAAGYQGPCECTSTQP
jgi:hypothetical protein